MPGAMYSFDVFDTLISRTVASPDGVWRIMRERLLRGGGANPCPRFLADNFCELRRSKEAFARRCARKDTPYREDCTLSEIYDFIAADYGLTDDEASRLAEMEVECEALVSVPVKANIERLVRLIEAGERVVLISDMYLPSSAIRLLLLKHNAVFSDVMIYVSSEIGKCKSTGHLYEYVKQIEKPSEWTHIGDNAASDVSMAKPYVTRAEHYKAVPLLDFEKAFRYHSLSNCVVAGIAQHCRREHKGGSVYRYGVSFAAPLLYFYTDWVVTESLRHGIRDLYFVARDGYVLKAIADIIIRERKLDIATHYFYSSRYASRVITRGNFDEYANTVLSWAYATSTFMYIADTFCADVKDLARKTGFTGDVNRHLKPKEIQDIKYAILHEGSVREYLIKRNEERTQLFLQYCKQEMGKSLGGECAFVEVHGSGYTQDGIARQIDLLYGIKAHSFFIAFNELVKHCSYSPKHSYLCNYGQIYEVLTRAPHGRTLSYRHDGSEIVSVLEFDTLKPMIDWGFDNYMNAMRDFTDAAVRFEMASGVRLNSLSLFNEYTAAIYSGKYPGLAAFIGDIPFAEGAENVLPRYAPPFTIETYCKARLKDTFTSGYRSRISLMRSTKRVRRLDSAWPKIQKILDAPAMKMIGRLSVTRAALRFLIGAVRAVRRLVKRVKKAFRRKQ